MERFIKIGNVNITEDTINMLYNVHLRNTIKLASNLEVKEISPLQYEHCDADETQSWNPYITNQDKLKELGLSVYENGPHWLFITLNDIIREGTHRMIGLKGLMQSETIKKIDYPCMNVDNDLRIWDNEVDIEYPSSYTIKQIPRFGLNILTRKADNYREVYEYFMIIPFMMRFILFEWEQKYGAWKGHKAYSDIKELRRMIKCYQIDASAVEK